MTTVTLCILSFFAGIGLTVYLFYEEIFDKRKVGYGENDIHLIRGYLDNGMVYKSSVDDIYNFSCLGNVGQQLVSKEVIN